jgi:hypothetical protein
VFLRAITAPTIVGNLTFNLVLYYYSSYYFITRLHGRYGGKYEFTIPLHLVSCGVVVFMSCICLMEISIDFIRSTPNTHLIFYV